MTSANVFCCVVLVAALPACGSSGGTASGSPDASSSGSSGAGGSDGSSGSSGSGSGGSSGAAGDSGGGGASSSGGFELELLGKLGRLGRLGRCGRSVGRRPRIAVPWKRRSAVPTARRLRILPARERASRSRAAPPTPNAKRGSVALPHNRPPARAALAPRIAWLLARPTISVGRPTTASLATAFHGLARLARRTSTASAVVAPGYVRRRAAARTRTVRKATA